MRGAKSYSGEVYLNNQECVGTAIYRLDDSNALDTINRVKAELEKLSKSFPEGVKYQITYDPTEFIRVTMSEIVTTLVVALLLVIAITYLFLQDWRPRSSCWPSWEIWWWTKPSLPPSVTTKSSRLPA